MSHQRSRTKDLRVSVEKSKNPYFSGDLIIPSISARIWNEEIIDTIGTFRHEEIGIVIRTSDCENYVWVLTSRGKTGWVLKTLVDNVNNLELLSDEFKIEKTCANL